LNPNARKIVARFGRMSTLPTVMNEVSRIVNDPNSQATTLAMAIEKDQVIAGQLLKLVNSALYGYPARIGSLSRAVTIVGFKQTRDIVLGASVINGFKASPASDFISLEKFWEFNLAVASISRKLGVLSKMEADTLFTSGLLHDIGRLVLFENSDKLPVAEMLSASREKGTLLYMEERDFIGCTHTEIAEVLMAQWNLPMVIRESVTFHHRPTLAGQYSRETAVIHIADALAHAMKFGSSGENLVPEIFDEAWNKLGLDYAKLDAVAHEVQLGLSEILEAFLNGG